MIDKERQVSSLLQSQGYEVYFPTIRVRKRGREKVVPFFACYLFARVNGFRDLSLVRWTPGLKAIVSFGGQPAVVPEDLITLLKQRLTAIRKSGYPVHPFRRGDRVWIATGPLADFEGVFEEGVCYRDRAKILVDPRGFVPPTQEQVGRLAWRYPKSACLGGRSRDRNRG